MTTQQVLQWRSAARTNAGVVRTHNEDSLLERPETGLWVVADGMGGHDRGAEASEAVVNALGDIPLFIDLSGSEHAVQQRLQSVHARLRKRASASSPETIIGSTVAVLRVHKTGVSCIWAGDSRIYRLRMGQLRQLTSDHTGVNTLVTMGALDPDDAEAHPAKHMLTRAVGANTRLTLDIARRDIRNDDMFLLCSDGLTNTVTEAEIASELIRGGCREACDRLLRRSLERGAPDNITVIVVQVYDPRQPDETPVNPALSSRRNSC